eukprot:5678869-Amphidinium_carterae.1
MRLARELSVADLRKKSTPFLLSGHALQKPAALPPKLLARCALLRWSSPPLLSSPLPLALCTPPQIWGSASSPPGPSHALVLARTPPVGLVGLRPPAHAEVAP